MRTQTSQTTKLTAHVGIWLFGLLLTSTHSKQAQASDSDAFVQLHWQRGADAQSCPAQAELEQLVRLRLGRNPFNSSSPRTLEASIEHQGSAWHVELHIRDSYGPTQGHRVFDISADSCAQVADAVGLAVALAIDPNASIASLPSSAAMQLESPEPAPKRVPEGTPLRLDENSAAVPVPRPYVYPQAAVTSPIPQSPAAPYKAQLALRGIIAGGLLPGAAPGLGVAGGVGGRWLQLTLGMTYLPEEWQSREFAFGLTTLDTGVCGNAPHAGWLTSSVCAEAHVGTVHSIVRGLMPLQPGDRFYGALSIGPKLGWRAWSPFFVEAGASAWVAFQRPQFALAHDTLPYFYEVREVSLLGFLGVGWTTDSAD